MDTYIQDLFSKDDIGFKPVNSIKDSTKIFVFTLNKYIKERDGKNITRTEIIRLAEEIHKLGEKMKTKMNSLLQEIEKQKKPRKTEKKLSEKVTKKSSSLIGQDIKDVKMIDVDSVEDPDESIPDKPDSEQVGGNIEHSVPEVSTIDLLNSINNNPCSSSVTQCGDFVTSCGQSGGGKIQNKNYELYESTLNNFKQFSISDQNKKILYDLVKIYTTSN